MDVFPPRSRYVDICAAVQARFSRVKTLRHCSTPCDNDSDQGLGEDYDEDYEKMG